MAQSALSLQVVLQAPASVQPKEWHRKGVPASQSPAPLQLPTGVKTPSSQDVMPQAVVGPGYMQAPVSSQPVGSHTTSLPSPSGQRFGPTQQLPEPPMPQIPEAQTASKLQG
jgi:hypothetical protein